MESVFSALVHDLDHPGVVNGQLCKEHHEWAIRYNNQSVAEQHSLDLAFRLLEKEEFKNLRCAIYKTIEEKKRFRRLVVNMVMATGKLALLSVDLCEKLTTIPHRYHGKSLLPKLHLEFFDIDPYSMTNRTKFLR